MTLAGTPALVLAALLLTAGVGLAGCVASPGTDSPSNASSGAAKLGLAESSAIRPGGGLGGYGQGLVGDDIAYGCTASFLLRSTSNGTYYLATAGHCLDKEDRNHRYNIAFDGRNALYSARASYVSHWSYPEVQPEDCGLTIAAEDTAQCWNDFGFLELTREHVANANGTVRTIRGPAPGAGIVAPGDTVHTMGASQWRAGTPFPNARSGVVVSAGEWGILAQFPTSTPPGDSGSPVLDEQGRPLGVVIYMLPVSAVLMGRANPLVGLTGIVRLDAVLAAAADVGWTDLVVVTGDPFTPPDVGWLTQTLS